MKILFLTYINRSGSTFLANLFSKSPDILVCPEGEILMNELLVKPGQPFDFGEVNRNKFVRYFKEDPKLKFWEISEKVIDNLPKSATNLEVFFSILNSYKNQTKPEASIVLFKAERLIHLFDNLLEFISMNDICFLSIVRDCRGVYASQKYTKFPETERFMSQNPVETAINWRIHVKEVLRIQKTGSLELIIFEELIQKPDEVFSALIEKLSIPFFKVEGKNGDLFNRLPESHKAIHAGILEKPILEKTDNWKQVLTKTEQCIIRIVAGKSFVKIYKNSDKHICPIFARLLLGSYIMAYLSKKIIKKLRFFPEE